MTNKVLGGITSHKSLVSGTHREASSNTPPQITNNKIPAQNRALIDWFSFTLKNETDPYKVLEICELSSLGFTASSGGGLGYKQCLRSNNIVIFYDGNDNMGCHVSMSGQGCRYFESVKNDGCIVWYRFFILLASLNAQVTRIDLAIDNIDKMLDLSLIQQAIDEKKIRSKFKGGHKIEGFSFSPEDTKSQGKTIYCGSSASRLKVRFYDKAAQLELDGFWTRCEIQCMGERATEATKILMQGVEFGFFVVTVLNNYFTPINLDDSNRSRCSTQAWWLSWIEYTEKIRLTTSKATKVISQVIQHIEKNYAPTFAMLKKYMGAVAFADFMFNLNEQGSARMTKKHEMIILNSKFLDDTYENFIDEPF